MIDKYIESYAQRFGELINVEKVEEKDLLKAELKQLDSNDQPLEGGVHADEATLSVQIIKDDKIRTKFLGLKKGDNLIVDLKKAFPSDVEIASMLKLEKEKVAELHEIFWSQLRIFHGLSC
jgi:trigger factor